MLTTTAAAAADLRQRVGTVATYRQLARAGINAEQRRAQLRAGRWQRAGKATVLHNGPLTRSDQIAVAVINCGPRAIVTSFTAAQLWGLRGWERDEIHVLAPAGTRRPRTSRCCSCIASATGAGESRRRDGASSASPQRWCWLRAASDHRGPAAASWRPRCNSG